MYDLKPLRAFLILIGPVDPLRLLAGALSCRRLSRHQPRPDGPTLKPVDEELLLIETSWPGMTIDGDPGIVSEGSSDPTTINPEEPGLQRRHAGVGPRRAGVLSCAPASRELNGW
jgi:hypothetical protein